MRFGLYESGLYKTLQDRSVRRGAFLDLLRKRTLFFKYLKVVGTGIPCYFTVAILVTGAPELSKALGLAEPATAGTAVLVNYGAMSVGGVAAMLYSQYARSRKKALYVFHLIGLAGILCLLLGPVMNLTSFYACYCLLGFAVGYVALGVTAAAEQFGTNLRATVTTSMPNVVRGATFPITLGFALLKENFGMVQAGLMMGGLVVALALLATWRSDETFGRDLDFVE